MSLFKITFFVLVAFGWSTAITIRSDHVNNEHNNVVYLEDSRTINVADEQTTDSTSAALFLGKIHELFELTNWYPATDGYALNGNQQFPETHDYPHSIDIGHAINEVFKPMGSRTIYKTTNQEKHGRRRRTVTYFGLNQVSLPDPDRTIRVINVIDGVKIPQIIQVSRRPNLEKVPMIPAGMESIPETRKTGIVNKAEKRKKPLE